MFVHLWIAVCCIAQAPAPSLLVQNVPAKQYQITLRTFVPTIKKIPTPLEMQRNLIKYNPFHTVLYHLKSQTPDKEDQEILARLQKQFPHFSFSKILKRSTFTLPTDKLWTAPKEFSMHDITLAIIQNNPKMMDDKSASPPTKPEPVHATPIAKGTPNYFSHRFPPATMKRIEEEGKLLLYMKANVRCVEEGKKFVFVQPTLTFEMEKTVTTPLINDTFNTVEGDGKKPTRVIFVRSEIVLITIKEVSK